MLALLSLVSVVTGATLAYGTKWLPAHAEVVETCAGSLLLVGFGLLGSALQQIA
jgi:hypothetical protein